MSARSKQLAEEFKAQQDAEKLARQEEADALQIKNAKALLDAKTIERDAPKIWDKFCTEFRKQCDEFNVDFGETVLTVSSLNSSQISVSRVGETSPSLRISFGPNEKSIRFGGLYGPKKGGELRIKVADGDSEPSLVTDDGRVVDLEGTVEGYIRSVLGL